MRRAWVHKRTPRKQKEGLEGGREADGLPGRGRPARGGQGKRLTVVGERGEWYKGCNFFRAGV